jgi:3,4-dihydroxy-2-butanone 4-phosphate synthase
MTTTFAVSIAASDTDTGVTLDDLIAFVTQCQRLDVDPATPLRVTAGWTGKIKTLRTA